MYLAFKNERLAPDVQSQPEVDLHHWRIVQRENRDLHITTQIASGALRVTSSLLAIDLSLGLVKTESGRNYRLCMPPEGDQLVRALLDFNAVRGIGETLEDVSESIWRAILSGRWANEDSRLLPVIQ